MLLNFNKPFDRLKPQWFGNEFFGGFNVWTGEKSGRSIKAVEGRVRPSWSQVRI